MLSNKEYQLLLNLYNEAHAIFECLPMEIKYQFFDRFYNV